MESDAEMTIRFVIHDSGIGIPSSKVPGLFEPFSQVDASTTRKYGGTGLGLAISKRLVEMMGGSIDVESRMGDGSTFSFTAALQRCASVTAAIPPRAAFFHSQRAEGASTPVARVFGSEKQQAFWRGSFPADETIVPKNPLNVLLAEDNQVNRRVARAMLMTLGCNAHCVSDGREAVEAAATGSYDLILMDCQMPEMDGLEATRRIRASEGKDRRVKIVALTANAMTGDRERCIEAGMDDYLTKPVRRADLAEMIERWAA
jgi:CheY-like chemotaxis protein